MLDISAGCGNDDVSISLWTCTLADWAAVAVEAVLTGGPGVTIFNFLTSFRPRIDVGSSSSSESSSPYFEK